VVEQDTWTRESWTDQGDVADAIAAHEGWHPQVRAILGAVEESFIWALFDRKPMGRWSVGRVEMARGTTDWSLKAIAWLYGYDATKPEETPID